MEDGYKRRVTLLLTEVSRCLEVPTVVSPDLLVLPEFIERLYYNGSRLYWVWEIRLESRIHEWQRILRGLYEAELYSVRSSGRVKYYFDFPSCWMKNELPSLLFVSLLFVVPCHSSVAIRITPPMMPESGYLL